MKSIRLIRPEENFNKNKSYKIYLDGQFVCELENGEEKEIKIDHRRTFFEAKMYWCGSQKVLLADNSSEQVYQIQGNTFLNMKLAYLGPVFPLIGLILNEVGILREVEVPTLIVLFLIVVGTLTIWKRKWIVIEQLS